MLLISRKSSCFLPVYILQCYIPLLYGYIVLFIQCNLFQSPNLIIFCCHPWQFQLGDLLVFKGVNDYKNPSRYLQTLAAFTKQQSTRDRQAQSCQLSLNLTAQNCRLSRNIADGGFYDRAIVRDIPLELSFINECSLYKYYLYSLQPLTATTYCNIVCSLSH